MSPRAAWRLERLGFAPVYHYAAGKVDWIAAGLSTVRADPSEVRALDRADRDPPTCRPSDRVAELPMREGQSVIVVNEERIVFGRLWPDRVACEAIAEDVMELGPATVRAHEPFEQLLSRMRTRNVTEIIVSTPEGELLGVVLRAGSLR